MNHYVQENNSQLSTMMRTERWREGEKERRGTAGQDQ